MSSNLIALQNRFLGRGDTVYDRLATLAEEKGSLTSEDLGALAEELNLPPAHVRSVAQFYDDLRIQDRPAERTVRLCNGEACEVAGASACRKRLLAAAEGNTSVSIKEVTCVGYCGSGPNVLFHAGKTTAVFSLAEEGAEAALVSAMESGGATGQKEPENLFYPAADGANVLLRHFSSGPSLDAAKNNGAYGQLERALKEGAEWVLTQVEASQIRGRGGAGFPAGRKLRTVAGAPSDDGQRYVVVNADEGDAGAYIDKELMERDPHAVIEGTIAAAFAVGADQGYIYLRAEYPKATAVIEGALEEARNAGLLGQNILGSDFSFELKLVPGHGAYICGEETSLLRSLEGVPAQVSPKPPYPAIQGLRNKPTLVNNVETLAALPHILEHGGDHYAALGYGRSRGTKLVSLNTAVSKPGLYEVELGLTLRSLIFDLAGGMAGGKKFKALQIGGPLGGIFGPQHLDLPLDFEALSEAGGMLGHAGIVVFPEDVDLVAVGRGLMKFTVVESCGKCFPCRIGAVRGTELFDKILGGGGTQADLELLAELCETMRIGSLCALGGAVPVPIDNLLTWFIDDFAKYITNAKTPSLLVSEGAGSGQAKKTALPVVRG